MNIKTYDSNHSNKGFQIYENLAFQDDSIPPVESGKCDNDSACFQNNSQTSKKPIFRLTDLGKQNAGDYIARLSIQRNAAISSGIDSAECTELPTVEDIEEDVNFIGLDSENEYINNWAITDNYSSDYPLLLKLNRDLKIIY